MSNGYGINGLGTYDPMAIMYDPAFLAAMQSYNVNNLSFRGEPQATQQIQNTDNAAMLYGTDLSAAVTPSFKAEKETEDGSGLFTKGALAVAATAGACIYAAKRGNGEGVIKGFKNIISDFKGKPTRAMKEFTLNLKDGSRIEVKGGKISGIKADFEHTNIDEIREVLNARGLNLPSNYLDGAKLSDNVSLTRYAISHENHKFFIENGKVVKIEELQGGGKIADVNKFMETYDGKSALQDEIASIGNGTCNDFSKLSDVSYLWTDPKTGIKVLKEGNVVKTLTLPSAELSEIQQKAWLNRNGDVYNQVQELISKGRTKGVKVDLNKYKDAEGNIYDIDANGQIKSIILKEVPNNGPQRMEAGTVDFDAWLQDRQDVKDAIKKEFESGLGFDGATFAAV